MAITSMKAFPVKNTKTYKTINERRGASACADCCTKATRVRPQTAWLAKQASTHPNGLRNGVSTFNRGAVFRDDMPKISQDYGRLLTRSYRFQLVSEHCLIKS